MSLLFVTGSLFSGLDDIDYGFYCRFRIKFVDWIFLNALIVFIVEAIVFKFNGVRELLKAY